VHPVSDKPKRIWQLQKTLGHHHGRSTGKAAEVEQSPAVSLKSPRRLPCAGEVCVPLFCFSL